MRSGTTSKSDLNALQANVDDIWWVRIDIYVRNASPKQKKLPKIINWKMHTFQKIKDASVMTLNYSTFHVCMKVFT